MPVLTVTDFLTTIDSAHVSIEDTFYLFAYLSKHKHTVYDALLTPQQVTRLLKIAEVNAKDMSPITALSILEFADNIRLPFDNHLFPVRRRAGFLLSNCPLDTRTARKVIKVAGYVQTPISNILAPLSAQLLDMRKTYDFTYLPTLFKHMVRIFSSKQAPDFLLRDLIITIEAALAQPMPTGNFLYMMQYLHALGVSHKFYNIEKFMLYTLANIGSLDITELANILFALSLMDCVIPLQFMSYDNQPPMPASDFLINAICNNDITACDAITFNRLVLALSRLGIYLPPDAWQQQALARWISSTRYFLHLPFDDAMALLKNLAKIGISFSQFDDATKNTVMNKLLWHASDNSQHTFAFIVHSIINDIRSLPAHDQFLRIFKTLLVTTYCASLNSASDVPHHFYEVLDAFKVMGMCAKDLVHYQAMILSQTSQLFAKLNSTTATKQYAMILLCLAQLGILTPELFAEVLDKSYDLEQSCAETLHFTAGILQQQYPSHHALINQAITNVEKFLVQGVACALGAIFSANHITCVVVKGSNTIDIQPLNIKIDLFQQQTLSDNIAVQYLPQGIVPTARYIATIIQPSLKSTHDRSSTQASVATLSTTPDVGVTANNTALLPAFSSVGGVTHEPLHSKVTHRRSISDSRLETLSTLRMTRILSCPPRRDEIGQVPQEGNRFATLYYSPT